MNASDALEVVRERASLCGDDFLPEVREAIATLSALVERAGEPVAKVARGDAARINAIQRHLWFVEPDYANGGWRVGKVGINGQPHAYAESLRNAIDHAIATAPGASHE